MGQRKAMVVEGPEEEEGEIGRQVEVAAQEAGLSNTWGFSLSHWQQLRTVGERGCSFVALDLRSAKLLDF